MSCLFNSLSFFINDKSSTHIRNIICDYLENNNSIIEGIDTSLILKMESNDYISNMRKTSTWGGGIEIQSTCNIWKFKIIVHNIRDKDGKKIEFIPLDGNFNNIIEITWNGGHYEPIRK
jgi:hypothetical protein